MKRSIIAPPVVFTLALLLIAAILQNCNNAYDTYKTDIIVYGGTSAAVIAAVEAVKSGKSVIVVSPDIHPGG